MVKTLTFNELRSLKDMLPDGSIHQIARELGITTDAVRTYFGGDNSKSNSINGIHIEPGPDGGIVKLDDTTIFDKALKILNLDDYPNKKKCSCES